MAPTFPLLLGGVFFAVLCIPSLLVLALGAALRSKALMWLGGIPLLLCLGLVGITIVGMCRMLVADALTATAGPYTRTAPNVEDLVGTYRLTPHSTRFVQRKGYANPPDIRIILRADGTFQMENMPDMWQNFGRVSHRFDTGAGTWKLDSQGTDLVTRWSTTMDFDDVQGFASEVPKNGFVCHNMFQLKNQHPPYLIHVFMGDADGGEALEFERVPAPSQKPEPSHEARGSPSGSTATVFVNPAIVRARASALPRPQT